MKGELMKSSNQNQNQKKELIHDEAEKQSTEGETETETLWGWEEKKKKEKEKEKIEAKVDLKFRVSNIVRVRRKKKILRDSETLRRELEVRLWEWGRAFEMRRETESV